MLIRLFSAHGFQEYQTNEPNLCLKPENLFMSRVGDQVPEQTRKAFKWLCFGISPGQF
jgi:acetoin utilization protein AcuA